MLNVGVLYSKRAPGLEALRERVNIACVVTTTPHPAFGHPLPASGARGNDCPSPRVRGEGARRADEGLIHHPIRGRIREEFDAETAAMLRRFDVDAVICLGYLYVITAPLLAAFPDRILNVHDSDLPRYPGLHATRDAIYAGERETRSSVHIVTPQLDGGPVIVRSEAFPVAPFVHEAVARGEHDIVRAYAYAQREWMMRSTWGALAADALQRLTMEAVA